MSKYLFTYKINLEHEKESYYVKEISRVFK